MGSSVRRLKPSATWFCNFWKIEGGILLATFIICFEVYNMSNIINTRYIYLEGAKWFDSFKGCQFTICWGLIGSPWKVLHMNICWIFNICTCMHIVIYIWYEYFISAHVSNHESSWWVFGYHLQLSHPEVAFSQPLGYDEWGDEIWAPQIFAATKSQIFRLGRFSTHGSLPVFGALLPDRWGDAALEPISSNRRGRTELVKGSRFMMKRTELQRICFFLGGWCCENQTGLYMYIIAAYISYRMTLDLKAEWQIYKCNIL